MPQILYLQVIDVWTKLKWEDQFYTHGALIEVNNAIFFPLFLKCTKFVLANYIHTTGKIN